ncbi:hypothetical protein HK102_011027, partial [Quaeritorhiza haematococci]
SETRGDEVIQKRVSDANVGDGECGKHGKGDGGDEDMDLKRVGGGGGSDMEMSLTDDEEWKDSAMNVGLKRERGFEAGDETVEKVRIPEPEISKNTVAGMKDVEHSEAVPMKVVPEPEPVVRKVRTRRRWDVVADEAESSKQHPQRQHQKEKEKGVDASESTVTSVSSPVTSSGASSPRAGGVVGVGVGAPQKVSRRRWDVREVGSTASKVNTTTTAFATTTTTTTTSSLSDVFNDEKEQGTGKQTLKEEGKEEGKIAAPSPPLSAKAGGSGSGIGKETGNVESGCGDDSGDDMSVCSDDGSMIEVTGVKGGADGIRSISSSAASASVATATHSEPTTGSSANTAPAVNPSGSGGESGNSTSTSTTARLGSVSHSSVPSPLSSTTDLFGRSDVDTELSDCGSVSSSDEEKDKEKQVDRKEVEVEKEGTSAGGVDANDTAENGGEEALTPKASKLNPSAFSTTTTAPPAPSPAPPHISTSNPHDHKAAKDLDLDGPQEDTAGISSWASY